MYVTHAHTSDHTDIWQSGDTHSDDARDGNKAMAHDCNQCCRSTSSVLR